MFTVSLNADRRAVQARKDNQIKIYGTFIVYTDKNIGYANERITDSGVRRGIPRLDNLRNELAPSNFLQVSFESFSRAEIFTFKTGKVR